MNVIKATQTGLSAVIDQLQKKKEELTLIYHAAITNGEKLQEVKTLYINLKDVDKRLTELMRVC
jgi:apolipoprotein N-acyltransferase